MNARVHQSGGDYVCEKLVSAGIDLVIGLPGTQTLPMDRAIAQRPDLRYLMARHETAIPHIAWGYYEAGGTPAATLTVPGPGDTNAMHGLKNALEDCVPIVHVSADVHPDERGKKPIHEIDHDTFDNVVKENLAVRSVNHLPYVVTRAIQTATTPPYGPVRIGIPKQFLSADITDDFVKYQPSSTTQDHHRQYRRVVEALAGSRRPMILIGGGARRSPTATETIVDLARTLDVPVAATYKGKGVFPEDDDRFVGVAGSILPASAREVFRRADTVIALGSDLDGVSTADWSLELGETLIHVNLDPSEFDAGYEADVRVVDDAGRAADQLLKRWEDDAHETFAWSGEQVGRAVDEEFQARLRSMGLLESGNVLTTPEALLTLRTELPPETVVTTDVGGFRLWAFELFETYAPETYVTAGSWAGMGVGLPSAIGAKLANPDRPVVGLTGDGGLMMCIHELHTAAEYGLDLVEVVFQNDDYGIISKAPELGGSSGENRFDWSSPSFDRIADGFGWNATTARTCSDLERAIRQGLEENDRPTLVVVDVDGSEPSVKEAGKYEPKLEL